MIMWCTISIVTMFSGLPWVTETAAKGKVIHETGSSYILDFSEYAKANKYEGNYTAVTVDKDQCIKDEK